MNKNDNFLSKNLSITAFIVVYILTVIIHIVSDSFIVGDQLGLFIVFLPFFLIGIALDFVVNRNNLLKRVSRIIAKLLPLGVIFLWLPNTILMNYGENPVIEYYFYYIGYVVWLFIALPFFIASFTKDGFRHKTIRSLTGTGAFAIVYMILTTKTGFLDRGVGFITILLSYYFMFYAISGIKKLNYVAPVIGILNAVALFIFSNNAGGFGWDLDINIKIDIIILITFTICILIRLYGSFTENKKTVKK